MPGNTLKVAYTKVPVLAAIPYVGPAKSEGYFLVDKKTGPAITGNCAYQAVEYELREAANGHVAIWVAPEQMAKVSACQL